MGSAFIDCWKCDVCGFRWIKGEIWPTHCASKKCRSRKWNSLSVGVNDAVVDTKSESLTPVQVRTTALGIAKQPMNMNDDTESFPRTARVSIPTATVAIEPVVDIVPRVDGPICMACEASMVEGTGKLAGRWACKDVSCPRYGIEVRR